MPTYERTRRKLPDLLCLIGKRWKRSKVLGKLKGIWKSPVKTISDRGDRILDRRFSTAPAVFSLLLISAVTAQAQAVDDLDCVDVVCQEVEINENLVAQINSEFTAVSADIATNAADIATNADGIATNADNIAANADNIATNADGIATNADNIATNADGIATNADGIATNADNIATFGDGITTNADNIATNTKNISQNTARIADLSSRVDENRAIASDGVAMALAAKVPTLLPDQNGAITFGLGNYDSSTALSIGMTARISYNVQAFGTVGYGFNSEKIGSSIGVMYAW